MELTVKNKRILIAYFTFSLAFINDVYAQKDCSQAPTAALRVLCEQLHRWDTNARAAPPVTSTVAKPPAIPGLPPGLAAELAPVAATPYQCMDLGCLCSYMGGNGHQGSNACTLANGQTLQKAVRKEYRLLSDDERNRYHSAVKAIKTSGEYDRIAAIHAQFATSGGAHSGPSFLPWHREFIKRFEIALRQVDSSLAIPFWDSTIDGHLPTPADSVIFTDEFQGTTDGSGSLVTGAFASWRTLSGRPNVQRQVGRQGTTFQDSDIDSFLGQTQIEMVLAYTAPQQGCTAQTSFQVMEYTHGNVHLFIGGDMGDQSTAANDPIFFNHHSFVDCLWEMWRQSKQDRNSREQTYPLDNVQCASPQHFGSAPMSPFEPWRNNDGLNNKYTDNMYEYGPRPSCSMGPNCGSKYLFCDQARSRCVSKVRIGGNCQGFEGQNVCHNGECQGGKCVQTKPTPPPTTPRPPPVPTVAPLKPIHVSCFNEHECCSVWAGKGECNRNSAYMKLWCKPSCQVCQPDYNIADECADRHKNCKSWSNSGECDRNKFWMAENCRKSCNRCSFSRQGICSGGAGANTVTVAPPPDAKCTSPGCYNENICCQLWGMQGECRKNPIWMQCNCRVSCGKCIPMDYLYGPCADYHPQCGSWAGRGECQKNGWMLENCKFSCRTCVSFFELQNMCKNAKGSPSAIFGGRRHRSSSFDVFEPRSVPIIRRRSAEINTDSSAPAADRHPEIQEIISGHSQIPVSTGMPSI